MPWQLLILFQNVLAATFAINSRKIALSFPRAALPVNILVYAVTALSGLAYAGLHGFSSVSFASVMTYGGFFFIAGLCFALTNIISFVVFQLVDAAIASLLSTCNIIAAVIVSSIAIHESLRPHQIVGAVIIILSMELVLSLKLSQSKHKKMYQAIGLSLAASLLFGLAVTTEKYLLNRVSLSTYLVYGWGLQFGGVLITALILGKAAKANFELLRNIRFYKVALPASFIRMFSGLLFIYSLKLSNNLSLVSVLSGLKVILAALFGAYFLSERNYLARKYEAAGLAIVGVAVIFWK